MYILSAQQKWSKCQNLNICSFEKLQEQYSVCNCFAHYFWGVLWDRNLYLRNVIEVYNMNFSFTPSEVLLVESANLDMHCEGAVTYRNLMANRELCANVPKLSAEALGGIFAESKKTER